jgi:hypothetical protein
MSCVLFYFSMLNALDVRVTKACKNWVHPVVSCQYSSCHDVKIEHMIRFSGVSSFWFAGRAQRETGLFTIREPDI